MTILRRIWVRQHRFIDADLFPITRESTFSSDQHLSTAWSWAPLCGSDRWRREQGLPCRCQSLVRIDDNGLC